MLNKYNVSTSFTEYKITLQMSTVSTYRIKGRRLVSQAINASLEFGYRLFDTGAHYDNQCDLGNAFKEFLPQHNLSREDIYIISKLGESQ